MNPGFESSEIEKLKAECEAEGTTFMVVEDLLELNETGEYVQFQFIGNFKGQEVIYDAALFTLELHYQSLLLEEAESRVAKIHKGFVPMGERDPDYKVIEEIDELVEEFMEEIEEEESLKVAEFVEIDESFEFGVGLEVALNVEEVTEEVIEKFIRDFNANELKLDKNLYSFKQED